MSTLQQTDPRWTYCSWVDGPGLAQWFRTEGLIPRREDSLVRALYRWERCGRVSVWSADRWVTYAGRHLSELPEGLWIFDAPARRSRTSGRPGSTLVDLAAGQTLETMRRRA